uniref:Uncharacterized protein n=1 Tax=Knipowitschia caucasica TaxID=637954 RepID=A0AAV2KC41_KNICA
MRQWFKAVMSHVCRSEEADGRALGPDRVEALGRDPQSGLSAGPGARGDQAPAEPRQAGHRAGPPGDVGGHVPNGLAGPRTCSGHIATETKEL